MKSKSTREKAVYRMARLTKQDTGITGVGSAAAPARRKTASAPRKRAIGASVASADAAEPALTEPVAELSSSREEIATLAYSYWVERGYIAGSPDEDWLRAEAELRQRAFAK